MLVYNIQFIIQYAKYEHKSNLYFLFTQLLYFNVKHKVHLQ